MQVLSFVVGTEEYGIEILRVHEIKCYAAITPIPHAPAHVCGVMNLRGAVVPVIDLRVRFGATNVAYTAYTVIILASVRSKTVGFVVDAVSDVLHISEDAMAPPPILDTSIHASCLQSIARIDERLLGMVNVDVIGQLDSTFSVGDG